MLSIRDRRLSSSDDPDNALLRALTASSTANAAADGAAAVRRVAANKSRTVAFELRDGVTLHLVCRACVAVRCAAPV